MKAIGLDPSQSSPAVADTSPLDGMDDDVAEGYAIEDSQSPTRDNRFGTAGRSVSTQPSKTLDFDVDVGALHP